ncbi:MAG: dihydroorotate dehydrogenase-like protein [Gemmataceae bacterium]
MVDLTTSYLGLLLRNPIVCSSSPLCQDLESLKRMEDSGAGAVVLHSLFEEQIILESEDLSNFLDYGTEGYAESLSYFPDMGEYNLGPEGYLEHLREAKALLKIPVIASLNGHTRGGWIQYARLIEEAGADALELNVYEIPTDVLVPSSTIEEHLVSMVDDIVQSVKIPVAVKLSPFFTSTANICKRLSDVGARGLVLFNRFYQPDFDLDRLEVVPSLWLSTVDELRLRLHWAAILFGHVKADIAITGGVHGAQDVLKSMMAGASVAMMTSALLRQGIEHLTAVINGVKDWMVEHEYPSIKMMQGSMSFRSVANSAAFERANYLKVLRAHALFPQEG